MGLLRLDSKCIQPSYSVRLVNVSVVPKGEGAYRIFVKSSFGDVCSIHIVTIEICRRRHA